MVADGEPNCSSESIQEATSPTDVSLENTHEHVPDRVNISEWIAHALADSGCTVVYGGHGGALVPLVNAVVSHPKLTWVCARNEHDAATMAAAHAKLTGGLGCVIATSGPGASNLVTGLIEAIMDRLPLVALTGLKPTSQVGHAEFQDSNQTRLFAGAGMEFSKTAMSADSVIPLLRDAVATALTRRTCAHIAVPVDVQAAASPIPIRNFCAAYANVRVAPRSLDTTILDEAAETLSGSPDLRHPRTIVAVGLRGVALPPGNEVEGEEMSAAILELAEALQAPVVTRLDAKGVVDETHPLALGVVGVHGKPGLEAATTLIASADRVVSIGVDDETILLCNNAGLQIRKVIEIEPDALMVSTRFVAEHTIIGNVKDACIELSKRVEVISMKVRRKRSIQSSKKLLETKIAQDIDEGAGFMEKPGSVYLRHGADHMIHEVETNTDVHDPDSLWSALHAGEWRKLLSMEYQLRYRAHVSIDSSDGEQYCHPASVLHAISVALEKGSIDTTVTVDVGDVTLWASLCLTLRGGSRTLSSERLGTMGYALCGGVAAVLAQPRPAAAIALAGDGGFQMTLQELSTFTQNARPGDKLLVVVFDNSLLGRVAFGSDDALGCELEGPDYVALARAFGGDGYRVDNNDDAENAVEKALSAEGLFLLHVVVDPKLKADMATFRDNSLVVMKSG